MFNPLPLANIFIAIFLGIMNACRYHISLILFNNQWYVLFKVLVRVDFIRFQDVSTMRRQHSFCALPNLTSTKFGFLAQKKRAIVMLTVLRPFAKFSFIFRIIGITVTLP